MTEWDKLNWKKLHYRVEKLQRKIAIAATNSDWETVRSLQKLGLNSYFCRMVAVRRVTTKKIKRTAGLDGKFWDTDEERFAKVKELNYRTYIASPFKRIYVPKDHDRSKKRPLSVPNIFDRAMQALCLIVIDPVVESVSDKHAYGFRLYRNAQDAVRDICGNFNFMAGNHWVLKADVEGCFDHVNHGWLLERLPFEKKLLKTILKCGYIRKNKFHHISEGIPQGGVLSPVLVNFTLTGFEKYVKNAYPNAKMIRYVDDFLFSSPSIEELKLILCDLSKFLAERGLWLSESKTQIMNIKDGVDFIGWNFRMVNGLIRLNPTELSKKEVLEKITHLVEQSSHWSATKFAKRLNYVIRGWTCYHAIGCHPSAFVDLDEFVETILYDWLQKRNPKLNKMQIYQKYYSDYSRGYPNFQFNDVCLDKFVEVQVKMPEELELHHNPYVERAYFRERKKKFLQRTFFNDFTRGNL